MSKHAAHRSLANHPPSDARHRSITVVELGGRLSGALAYALGSVLRDPAVIRAVRVGDAPGSDLIHPPLPITQITGDISAALAQLSGSCDVLVVECPTDEFEQATDPVLVNLRRNAQCLLIEVDDKGAVVRASGREGWPYSTFDHTDVVTPPSRVVVVGVDGSPGSDAAVRWARVAALRWRALLRIVAACEQGEAKTGLQRSIGAVWAEKGTVETTVVVFEGHPVEVLLEQSKDADLLVVGRHSTSGLVHSVMSSVGDACGRLATCPVVVVPTTWVQTHQVGTDQASLVPPPDA